jgi:pyruvate/2-oxoglutarate dehydrogenase complex dihydrolipoamide dehydrogenase (E3) component
MPQSEKFEVLVLGSGTGGKLIAWYMAQSGRRTAVVERRWVGGSCPNIACMPSKNEISSARIAHLQLSRLNDTRIGPKLAQQFADQCAADLVARVA